MKLLAIILFAPLSVISTRLALAQVDPFYATQQVYYALTLSDAIAAPHLHRGMKVMVATNGVNPLVEYTVIDAGTKTVSSPTVVNCTGSSCQLVAESIMVVDGSLTLSKFPTGTTNYVITNKGTGNVWAPVDDAIHGSRGGGSLHATGDYSQAGFMPRVTLGGPGMLLTDGTIATWGLPSTLGIVTGSGTQSHLLVYAFDGTAVGNSSITDNGSHVTTSLPMLLPGWISVGHSNTPSYHLDIRGTSGNTSIALSDSGASTYSQWLLTANAHNYDSGNRGAFVITNGSDLSHPRFWMDDMGVVGLGTNVPGNRLSLIDPSTTSSIPALGANGGQLGILAGGGLYGLLAGVLGTGNVFLQAQRVDGTATDYSLLLQPNGGATGFGVTDPDTAVDALAIRLRSGAAVGRFLVSSDAYGHGAWSNSLSALAGVTFASSAVLPMITQTVSASGTAPTQLTIAAQSSSDSSWGFLAGNLNLLAGSSTASAKGSITFGYQEPNGTTHDAAYGSIDSSGSMNLTGALTAAGPIAIDGGSWVIARSHSGVSTREDVAFCQGTTTGTGQFVCDLAGWPEGSAFVNGKAYSVHWTVMSKGDVNATEDYVATFHSFGNVMYLDESYWVKDTGKITVFAVAENMSLIRLIVYSPGVVGLDVTLWSVKIVIDEN